MANGTTWEEIEAALYEYLESLSEQELRELQDWLNEDEEVKTSLMSRKRTGCMKTKNHQTGLISRKTLKGSEMKPTVGSTVIRRT